MSAKYWKLVITPLSLASAAVSAAREVVVEGDNWLSALRAARKALGEEGGVPSGASCVMSATGEVTILDAAQRLRYQLVRSQAAPVPAPKPVPDATPEKQAVGSLPPPNVGRLANTVPKRATTIAYSAEESAAVRAQLHAAQAAAAALPSPPLPTLGLGPLPALAAPLSAASATSATSATSAASAASPATIAAPEPEAAKAAFAPARPLSRPPMSTVKPESQRSDPRRPIPGKRSATVGYSGVDASQAAAPAATATDLVGEAAAALAETVPPPAAAGLPPPVVQLPSAQPPEQTGSRADEVAPTPVPVALGARAGRRQTIAYSPEESAAVRAQLVAAQAAVQTSTSLTSSAQDHLVQSEVPSMMVTLGHRDEEPTSESPLTYRERSYFWEPPADRTEVERALRAELADLRKSLGQRPRGQYVNLAVFDHAFEDKPARAPVATLQWKDWRGEPSFVWLSAPAAAEPWTAPQPGAPVSTSFYPDPASGPVPAPREEPVASNRPTQRTRRPSVATPAPDNQQEKQVESTGEQDLRLAVAFEATQDLYFLSTPADGLDFAVKLLGELIPCEAVSGCIYDINTDEFRFVAVTGTGAAERRAAAVRSKSGLFSAAARSGLDSLIIRDIANEQRYEPETDGREGLVAENMAFFVLHRGNQLFGMLQIINREGAKGFREGDNALGTYIANQVTAFLREKRGLGGG